MPGHCRWTNWKSLPPTKAEERFAATRPAAPVLTGLVARGALVGANPAVALGVARSCNTV
jgi:hypothetical protein